MKIFIGKKHSCDLNYIYPLLSQKLFDLGEFVTDVSDADVIVFPATCCGAEETIKYVMCDMLDVISKKKESATTFITGCMTRSLKEPKIRAIIEEFLNENFDYVIPEDHFEEIVNIISQKKVWDSDFGAAYISKNRLNLYISRGCMNQCSFCKMQYQDLPTQSVCFEDIQLSMRSLPSKVDTVNIFGTNIAQYGIDFAYMYNLMDVIGLLEEMEQIKYINLHGFAFKDAIQNKFASDLKKSRKVTKIGGSIETGSPRLLSMMNKGYTISELVAFWEEIQEFYPKKLITDIIVGFPTETYKDMELTLQLIEKLKPKEVNLHSYQNSYLIPSSKFEQLPREKIIEHYKIYKRELGKITEVS